MNSKNNMGLFVSLILIIIVLMVFIGYLLFNKKENIINNNMNNSSTTTTTTNSNVNEEIEAFLKTIPSKSDIDGFDPISLLDEDIIKTRFKKITKSYEGLEYTFECVDGGIVDESTCGAIDISFNNISYIMGTEYGEDGGWNFYKFYFKDDYIIMIAHDEAGGFNWVKVYKENKLIFELGDDEIENRNTFILSFEPYLWYDPVVSGDKIYYFDYTNNYLTAKYYDIQLNKVVELKKFNKYRLID